MRFAPRAACVALTCAVLAAPVAAQTTQPQAPERVIALSFRGSHRAYPLSLFPGPRVLNDVVGAMEIAVFHDPASNLSTAWFRTVFGEPIEFAGPASGTRAEDLTTVTLWDMATGVAIGGNLAGQRLVPVPFTMTAWEEWVASHPEAQPFRPEGQ